MVILRKGLGLSPDQAVGLDRPELKPPEKKAAARILGSNPYIRVSFLPCKFSSMKGEAHP
jgi:putative transposase